MEGLSRKKARGDGPCEGFAGVPAGFKAQRKFRAERELFSFVPDFDLGGNATVLTGANLLPSLPALNCTKWDQYSTNALLFGDGNPSGEMKQYGAMDWARPEPGWGGVIL